MKQINSVVKLSVLFFVILSMIRCVSAQSATEEILQRYSESAKRLRTLHAKATVFFDENRVFRQYYECVLDLSQKKYLHIQSDSPELVASRSTYYREGFADVTSYLAVTLGQEQEDDIRLSGLKEFSPIHWNIFFSQTPFAAPLHFHELIGIPESIYSFMESISLNVKTEKEEGNEYVVLFAEVRECRLDVWIDSQKDFAVKKFLFSSKKDNDLANGVKTYFYIVNEFGASEELYFPRSITIGQTFYERELTLVIPGYAEPEKRITPSRTTTKEIDFYSVEVNPKLTDDSFRFRTTPPNYTLVHILDQPQIDHVWLDGKIIPLTDELALARARGHAFVPGVREPRFWMLALGIGMILFACGRIVYKHFNR